MVEKRLKIMEQDGLHLRPAKELCRIAGEYESNIMIRYCSREFNAKSLLGVLRACLQEGDEITLACTGTDEEAASKALAAFLEKKTADGDK